MGMPTCRACAQLVAAKAAATWGRGGAHPVGQAGPGVGLMDHDGDLPAPGGEVQRGADIAADAHQDVGAGLVQDAPGLLHGAGQPAGQPQQVQRKACAGSGTRSMVASSRPAAGTSRVSIPAGVPTARSRAPGRAARRARGDGQERADVAGGSAAGEDDGQVLGVHEVLVTLSCGLRSVCAAAGSAADFSILFGPDGRVPSVPGRGTAPRRRRTATSAGPSRRRK